MSEQAEIAKCPYYHKCEEEEEWYYHPPVVLHNDNARTYFVHCPHCYCYGPEEDSKADAIAAWNQRAGEAAPSEEEILAHQYEPSFVAKLPLEKRREILARQSAENYYQVEPIEDQPPTETMVYCQGCQEKEAELAALRKLREAVQAVIATWDLDPYRDIAEVPFDRACQLQDAVWVCDEATAALTACDEASPAISG